MYGTWEQRDKTLICVTKKVFYSDKTLGLMEYTTFLGLPFLIFSAGSISERRIYP